MRTSLLVLFIIALSGCATAYQPKGFSGGYSETQLGENIFKVYFRGNGYTSPERASDFSLLRSAELMMENGFRYFIIVESEKDTKVGTYTTPSTSHTSGSVYSSGNYAYGSATTTTSGGQTYVFSKPTATNTLYGFNEKPEVNGLVYDAQFVTKSIKQKYQIGN